MGKVGSPSPHPWPEGLDQTQDQHPHPQNWGSYSGAPPAGQWGTWPILPQGSPVPTRQSSWLAVALGSWLTERQGGRP